MRLYLSFVVFAIAGVAYFWNSQPVSPAAESTANADHLFDWQSAGDPLNSIDAPLVVRDTINSTRSDISSVLDEFVRDNAPSERIPEPMDDIVAQTASEESSDGPSSLSELVPFATSDDATEPASAEPVDTETAVSAEAPAQPRPIEQPPVETTEIETPVKEAHPSQPVAGKPAINEATLVTKRPETGGATAPARESATASKPSTESSQPKSELLSGGKAPEPNPQIADTGWKVVAKSTSGLPMHTRRFGHQGTRTMVIAGLDGRDQVATPWVDELAEVLAPKRDLLQSHQILIFRAGNPDGLTQRSAGNPRGVLINRNFPGRRFRRLPDRTSGPAPSSELETQAVVAALTEFKPQRLIHLSSTTGPSTILYNSAAKELALDLERQFQWKSIALNADQMSGSLEEYADGTLDVAVLSIRLNSGTDWQKAWQKQWPGVVVAIRGANPLVSVSNERTGLPPESVGSPVRLEDDPVAVKKSRRGYEELPPPPR